MNIAKIMKQAQRMQDDLKKIQEELAKRTYEGVAGGGAVKAICTGDSDLKSVKISSEVFKDGDAEMLQDLVLTAVREAMAKAKQDAQDKMSNLTAGMELPGGLGF
ncbi:MAG: YbaB/EbfC family nucleoid-associated protein [Verrucomicrobiota bacterium]